MRPNFYVFCTLWLLSNKCLETNAQWTAFFDPSNVTVTMTSSETVHVILSGLSSEIIENINNRNYVRFWTENSQVATVDYQDDIVFIESEVTVGSWEASFNINGVFIGSSRILVEIETTRSESAVNVTVLRLERLVDTLFSVSIIILLGILFINFGAAINMTIIKSIIVKPIGASLGVVGTLVFMPLLAYSLGIWLFREYPEMALGLFLVGIAPSAGASNIFTLLMGGNINLSILMTTISTLAVFGTMPLWLFTLGATIFDRADLSVPYLRITVAAVSLLIPLGIGLIIQRVWPTLAKFLVRILKPLSGFFIIFVIIFATVVNLYMIQLVTWQVAFATMLLPWFGFIVGWISSLVFRQTRPDTIAIILESGSKNTGLVMFLITFALEQPAADIAMIIPIAVSILTPIPLILYAAFQKILQWRAKNNKNTHANDSSRIESVQTTE